MTMRKSSAVGKRQRRCKSPIQSETLARVNSFPSRLGRTEVANILYSDPLRLCNFLVQACLDRGVHLHQPAVALSVDTDVRDELARVRIGHTQDSTETDVPCTRLLVAAGAWSGTVFEALFPRSTMKLPISSLAGHSLVVRIPREMWQVMGKVYGGDQAVDKDAEGGEGGDAGCHAVFSTSGDGFSPEVFSRVGGDIYVAGLNSASIPLPGLPTESKVSEKAVQKLRETADRIIASGQPSELEVVREALCFRPVTPSGRPVLCRVADKHLGIGTRTRPGSEGGVFLAAGHGPWGISLSLGTGKAMAEMMQGRALSADVSSLGVA